MNFVYNPYVDGVKKKRLSMQVLNQKIEAMTGKKGIEYNGMIDDQASETLKDVNNIWNQYDFVITKNRILR